VEGFSDASSLREPNLCAYAQVNSAPSKKIWAESRRRSAGADKAKRSTIY